MIIDIDWLVEVAVCFIALVSSLCHYSYSLWLIMVKICTSIQTLNGALGCHQEICPRVLLSLPVIVVSEVWRSSWIYMFYRWLIVLSSISCPFLLQREWLIHQSDICRFHILNYICKDIRWCWLFREQSPWVHLYSCFPIYYQLILCHW